MQGAAEESRSGGARGQQARAFRNAGEGHETVAGPLGEAPCADGPGMSWLAQMTVCARGFRSSDCLQETLSTKGVHPDPALHPGRTAANARIVGNGVAGISCSTSADSHWKEAP